VAARDCRCALPHHGSRGHGGLVAASLENEKPARFGVRDRVHASAVFAPWEKPAALTFAAARLATPTRTHFGAKW
jgi:hypothetical protein